MHGHGHHGGHGPFAWMGSKKGPWGEWPSPHPPHPPHPPHSPFHGPPPWMAHMFGPPRRPERGEVRLLILDAIADQPRHGYEVIQTIENASGGSYRPSAGTVYPTLQMLEEMGQASVREEGGKKIYEITEAGKVELESHRLEVDEAYERLRPEGPEDDPTVGALFHRVHRLGRSLAMGFKHGRIGQQKLGEILEVVEEAAGRIEGIIGRK